MGTKINRAEEAQGFDPRRALWCLARIARHFAIDLDEGQIAHKAGLSTDLLTADALARLARDIGLTARVASLTWEKLGGLGEALPAILLLRDGATVILSGTRTDRGAAEVVILDPASETAGFQFWTQELLAERWSGKIMLLARRYAMTNPDQPFGLRWFVPEILRQRRAMIDIALAAFVLHGLGLVLPLFFQLVIDRVVVHQGAATLTVLGVGVLIALVFDAGLNYLRSYILLHAGAKIDIRVTTRVFSHLLSIPVQYFEQRPAGVVLKNAQQDRTVREFLTGRLLQVLLDASALLVFLPILMLYSVTLAALVLAFSALIGAIIFMIAGPFRRRLTELYRAEAECQALLNESIHGITTIKSLALEPVRRRQWDDRAAFRIARHLEVGEIATLARTISGFLEKVLTVAIIWTGVELVFGGTLSIGQLVAFQMLAGRVSGPLVQLVSLVNDYQEAALSVRMLGEVMNTKPEPGLNRGLRTPISGALAFEGVSFAYPGAPVPALENINIAVPPGGFLGIVGKSGSGKTTLVRLIQGLHAAQRGLLRIDGADINEIDKVNLRRAIGIVAQESMLFRGTVRENIAASRPGATLEEIVAASRVAGAEEFIQRLPQGYETVLEESASNLSGGQRQRLAIARALLRQPRILILDEATSALDPDSEAVLQRQMPAIARGRTVIAVSHRLSFLRGAHRILVLDEGRMVGFDTHDRLIETCPLYARLWRQQSEAFQ